MIDEVAFKKMHDTKAFLSKLDYECEIIDADETIRLEAQKQKLAFSINYSEEGDRGDYSLYDLDCIVRIDGGSYILILSERGRDDIGPDFKRLNTVISSIESGDFHFIHEKHFVFWRRTYLVFSDETHLLKTR